MTQHYLFAPLDEAQRRQVQAHSRVRQLDADAHLFVQDDRADAFWWLESGQIKLYRLSRDGHQKVMGLVAPRQSFAEGILFMETPRYPVNAQAVSVSTVHGFDRDTYLTILETSFATCRGLFRQMVRRTQRHLDEIEALTIQNARFRLVHYLLRLRRAATDDEPETIRLPARKGLIASQLAMQPETLSRLFRELEREGLIGVRGDSIRIKDAEALQRLLL
ncbi:MAG TPA: Crp/Fnr family transcriptional regulator [Gammaproteobacteria bacterium]|nr:Crp/Fnr family transcriptional regulator [Gammaproteobacteria bacterium]